MKMILITVLMFLTGFTPALADEEAGEFTHGSYIATTDKLVINVDPPIAPLVKERLAAYGDVKNSRSGGLKYNKDEKIVTPIGKEIHQAIDSQTINTGKGEVSAFQTVILRYGRITIFKYRWTTWEESIPKILAVLEAVAQAE